jgi:hypothetical protein
MMNSNSTMTTNNVTDDQIQDLRDEACSAGDYEQVELCDLAVATALDLGMDVWRAERVKSAARAACAKAIAASRAG